MWGRMGRNGGAGDGSVSGKELKGTNAPALIVDFYCQPPSSSKVRMVLGYWGGTFEVKECRSHI